MKNTNVLIIAGAVLAGAAYNLGHMVGHNKCLCKCQRALLEGLTKTDKKEEKEES